MSMFDPLSLACILGLCIALLALWNNRAKIIREAQDTLQTQFDIIQQQKTSLSLVENDLGVANAEILEKTYMVDEERIKADEVLMSVLPSSVVYRIKAGEDPIADEYAKAGILIVDIHGFSSITQRYSVQESVQMLNWLFSLYDEVVERYGLDKLKTVGDTYIITSGIPNQETYSPRTLALCALDLRTVSEKFLAVAGTDVQLRMGLDVGAVMAGVIGKHKFSYDIWGPTVNTAQRLQAECIPTQIHCSKQAYTLLSHEFDLKESDASTSSPEKTYYLLQRK
jgi:adenylate cyclase